MARDEDLADARTASHSGTWVADYSARFAKTAEEPHEPAPRRPTPGTVAGLWLEALQQPIWGGETS
jgi:hypothetical protein